MTEEELQEYNRLVDVYNQLVEENARLEAELDLGISNCFIVAENIGIVGKDAVKSVRYVSGELDDSQQIVDKLYKCLYDLTENYFLFKNISEASKKLTKYNDDYNAKFKYYNELRRITLGYVIGLDSHIVSNETLRKKVEKAYLANTDYWLAYAITAVMLWASNEKEAAYRALNKALSMDYYKSSVFFMLVNLRFGRIDVARNWYITLLDKTDVNNMNEVWQHVLHAYLVGAMKNEGDFNKIVESYFDKMMVQVSATSADYSKKVINKARSYADHFIHTTEKEYPILKELCPDYSGMKKILSDMEKISEMTLFFDDVYQTEPDNADNIFEEVENILYDLINSYDEREFEVVKNIKYNEAIMAAKGDMALANEKCKELYGEINKRLTFGDLMINWAFSEDPRKTDIVIKKFALNNLKDRISTGFMDYYKNSFASLKEKYTIKIPLFTTGDILEFQCDENGYETASETVKTESDKTRGKFVLADKLIKIFGLMGVGALVILAIAAFIVGSDAFTVFLILGITLGIVSGFLIWRRYVELQKQFNEKIRLTLIKLRNGLDEMAEWRKLVKKNYEDLESLQQVMDKF